MSTALLLLQRLQKSVWQANNTQSDIDAPQRLYFAEMNGLFHVEYYGTSRDEPYETFLKGICSPDIATNLFSLALRGPDEGANGVRNWDITGIVESDAHFPRPKQRGLCFPIPLKPTVFSFALLSREMVLK